MHTEEGACPLRLFDAADKRLYMAKEKGRNNIVSD
jgi:PleD family two-component response regulator